MADAWYTVYGDSPQILLGIVSQEGEEQLESSLSSPQWHEAVGELDPYIADYRQRIVLATGQFQF